MEVGGRKSGQLLTGVTGGVSTGGVGVGDKAGWVPSDGKVRGITGKSVCGGGGGGGAAVVVWEERGPPEKEGVKKEVGKKVLLCLGGR